MFALPVFLWPDPTTAGEGIGKEHPRQVPLVDLSIAGKKHSSFNVSSLIEGLTMIIFLPTLFLIGGTIAFALLQSSTLLPILLGAICAAIGLVCNGTFNYARSVSDQRAFYLNQRAGRLVSMLALMVLCTVATIPTAFINFLGEESNSFLAILKVMFIMFLAAVAILFLTCLLLAMADLIYIARFIPLREETEQQMAEYESKYESNFFKVILFLNGVLGNT